MKVVLIGDSSVGKSALAHRFIENSQLSLPKATVGIAFFRRTVVDPDTDEEHALQIWDTAGQEKFQSVTTHHYRNADGGLLVFDITSEASFLNLDRWLSELRENTEPGLQVMLVGSKVDLSPKRVVSEDRARAYAAKNGCLYAETSSMWDKHAGRRGVVMGVELLLLTLVKSIVQSHEDAGCNRLDMAGFYGKKGLNTVMLGEDDGMKAGPCEC